MPVLDFDLDNFPDYPYTDKIDGILKSHTDTFLAMISKSTALDISSIPVLVYLQNSKQGGNAIARSNVMRGLISLPGYVLLEDQARIVNWLFNTVTSVLSRPQSEATPLEREVQCLLTTPLLEDMTPEQVRHKESSAIQREILGTAVLAHAITIFILGDRNLQSLAQAFEVQTRQSPSYTAVDVGRECLSILEERLFNTGEEDWGLDAGEHQDGWNPYDGVREVKVHNNEEVRVP